MQWIYNTIREELTFQNVLQAPAGGALEAAKPVTKEEVIEARDAWINAVQVYTVALVTKGLIQYHW